jgi:sodium/potassium-transporting ATPase subunit alpha
VAPSDSIHRLDADAALHSLDSRVTGLTTAEALARAQEFGPNALEEARGPSALAQFLAQLAALAEAWNPGSGMATLAAAVVAVIVVNGLFSFWQERRASQALEALQRLLPSGVRVRRDGLTSDLPATVLVPGDMVALAEGDQVPADCRLIEAFDLRVDNATLTGESVPIERNANADLDTRMTSGRSSETWCWLGHPSSPEKPWPLSSRQVCAPNSDGLLI